MSQEDVAILMSAYQSFKNDVKEMFKEFKREHDERANERHVDTIKNIHLLSVDHLKLVDKIGDLKINCYNFRTECAEKRDSKELAKENLRSENLKWKLATFGGWTVAIMAILVKIYFK